MLRNFNERKFRCEKLNSNLQKDPKWLSNIHVRIRIQSQTFNRIYPASLTSKRNVGPKSPHNWLWSCRSRDCPSASEKGIQTRGIRKGAEVGRCRSFIDDVSKRVTHSRSGFPGEILTFSRLKVLSKVGLADFVTSAAPHVTQFCDRASDGDDLGVSDLPQTFVEKYGFPGCGVKRTALNLNLKEGLAAAGILVYEGWKLKEVIESEKGVIAVSEDGREVEGSFLIGCDGIKAVSRSLILRERGVREEKAEYTGLTQASPLLLYCLGLEY
jgi:hypothetical protein